MTAADTQFDDIKARRNALILASAQALYGATLTAVVVTSGLVGAQLAPSPSWATLPMSMTIVGTALTTFPISLLMRRVGRRVRFVTCALAGGAGNSYPSGAAPHPAALDQRICQSDQGIFTALGDFRPRNLAGGAIADLRDLCRH